MSYTEFTVNLVFKYEKETPGTWRYKEVTNDYGVPYIGTIYLRKRSHPSGARPIELHVDVTMETE